MWFYVFAAVSSFFALMVGIFWSCFGLSSKATLFCIVCLWCFFCTAFSFIFSGYVPNWIFYVLRIFRMCIWLSSLFLGSQILFLL